MKIKSLIIMLMCLAADPLHAAIKEIDLQNATCNNDYYTAVNSLKNHCIRLVSPDAQQSKADVLVIYLHGDYGIGGASYMSGIASHFSKPNRMNIAMIRPGYFDDEGNFSTGNDLGAAKIYGGRVDNYTHENVDIIADAISNLKKHYKAKRVLVVGHSGGAALAALLLNFYPQLVDGALLINCPCDIKHWKPDWERSLSPNEHMTNISDKAIIRCISGAEDDVVIPEYAKNYTQQLIENHKNAKFYLGIGMKHNMSDDKTKEIALISIQKFLDEANQPKK